MSYVDNNLMPGERVLARARVHWLCYIQGVLIIIISIALAFFVGPYALLGCLLGLVYLFLAWLRIYSTELAVTNKRVIAKFGFIRRSTVELLHRNVESLQVEQGVIARIFDYGTLVLNGTGSIRELIPDIAGPLEFRRSALAAIDENDAIRESHLRQPPD